MRQAIVAAVLSILSCASTAQAAVATYTWIGGVFDTATANFLQPCLAPTPGCVSNVEIELIMPALAHDLALQVVVPSQFTITDGYTTITEATAGFDTVVELATGSAGEITQWNIITGPTVAPSCLTISFTGIQSLSIPPGGGFDAVGYTQGIDDEFFCEAGANAWYDNSGPGQPLPTWTISVVPLPAAGWLLFFGASAADHIVPPTGVMCVDAWPKGDLNGQDSVDLGCGAVPDPKQTFCQMLTIRIYVEPGLPLMRFQRPDAREWQGEM